MNFNYLNPCAIGTSLMLKNILFISLINISSLCYGATTFQKGYWAVGGSGGESMNMSILFLHTPMAGFHLTSGKNSNQLATTSLRYQQYWNTGTYLKDLQKYGHSAFYLGVGIEQHSLSPLGIEQSVNTLLPVGLEFSLHRIPLQIYSDFSMRIGGISSDMYRVVPSIGARLTI